MTDGHRVYGLEVTHEDVSEVKDRSSFNDWFNRTKECTPYHSQDWWLLGESTDDGLLAGHALDGNDFTLMGTAEQSGHDIAAVFDTPYLSILELRIFTPRVELLLTGEFGRNLRCWKRELLLGPDHFDESPLRPELKGILLSDGKPKTLKQVDGFSQLERLGGTIALVPVSGVDRDTKLWVRRHFSSDTETSQVRVAAECFSHFGSEEVPTP